MYFEKMNLAETLARVDLTDERQQQQLYQWFEQCKDDQSAIQFACDSLTQRTYGDRDQVRSRAVPTFSCFAFSHHKIYQIMRIITTKKMIISFFGNTNDILLNCLVAYSIHMHSVISVVKVVFFLFLILEAEAKRLDTTDALVPLDSFKITLVETCKYAALCPNFVSSKIAQVMAVSFTKLYPKHWPDFFDCLIQCGPDILLSTLIQIDGEVVNRRIHHTKVFRL